MFNLKDMAKEQPTHNLENDGTVGDAVAAFADGYEVGMGEAQIESGFDVLAEANDDMGTLVEARALVDQNLESGEVTAELGEAYRATMLRMEGKYGVTGLADANLESADAVKGFLKKLAANAAMIIAKITATAKKVWLKFSAWLATSDDKVKSLTKKLEGLKTDKKEVELKGEEKAKAYFTKVLTHKALNGSLGKDDVLETLAGGKKLIPDMSAAEKAIDAVAKADGSVIQGAIEVTSAMSSIEIDNEKTAELAKDKGTKAFICGLSTTAVTVLLVNDAYSPEGYDGDPYAEYKMVNLKREIAMEDLVDAEVKAKGLDKEGAVAKFGEKEISEELTRLGNLPKGKDLQKLIKNGFGKLDKLSKEVGKSFGKPDEWADKGKAAMAKKDAYVYGSKAVFSIVKTAIAEYRATMDEVNTFASLPVAK